MKKYFTKIIIVFVAVFIHESVIGKNLKYNFDSIFLQYKEAVVLISTYDLNGNPLAQGTGFIAGSDGYIITNYHVIIGACSIEVKLWDERILTVKQYAVHETNDIALLKIDANNLPVVKIGDIQTAAKNDSVIVISNPGGLRNIYSTGKILKIDESTFDIDAVVTHGSSGGPVFNVNGTVIGFIVAGIKNSMVNKAIVIDDAKKLLERKKLENIVGQSSGDIKQDFELGVNAASHAKWNEALKCFNSVLQKQPSNMEAYLEIARIHQNRGFYDLAILGYNIVEKNKQYLKDDFDIIDLLFNRGLCNTKINLYDEAAADFQSVLKLGRDNLKCKSFYNLYVVYSSAQKYDLAISNFYKALDCAQELIIPSQWSSIGNIYLKLGQLDSAEAAINRAINRGDKGTTPYLYLTDLYLQKRDTIKAVEILKKAVAINSMDFDLWNQMGSLYFDLKNYTEAVKAYDSACRIEPENESANYNRCVCFLNLSVQYLAQNLFSECLETLVPASRCNKLKEKTDRIKFEAYAAIGLEQYNKGNFTAAIDTFKLALDIERNDWAVWYNLGLAYSMNKQNEEALISFTEAIKLGEDSKKAKSYLQRGGIYNNINKPLRAIEDFKQALSLPGTARLIGLTYISMGEDSLSGNKYFKAAALADSALKYEPENSSAYFLRGQATMLSGNTRKALLDFKKIQRDSALLYRVSCAKAQIFLDLGVQGFNHARYSAAEDTLKLALQEICICDDPQFKTKIHPKIWNMLGLVYSETLRYKEAVDAYTRAIELNPEYPQYRYYRGGAKYKMEQYVMARKDLQTAVKLDPQYADAHRMLLEVSFKLSDMDGACRECSELEKLKIDDLNYPCKKRILDQFGSQCPN